MYTSSIMVVVMLVGAYDQLNVLKVIYSLLLGQQDILLLAKISVTFQCQSSIPPQKMMKGETLAVQNFMQYT